eukprot:ctg_69.g59
MSHARNPLRLSRKHRFEESHRGSRTGSLARTLHLLAAVCRARRPLIGWASHPAINTAAAANSRLLSCLSRIRSPDFPHHVGDVVATMLRPGAPGARIADHHRGAAGDAAGVAQPGAATVDRRFGAAAVVDGVHAVVVGVQLVRVRPTVATHHLQPAASPIGRAGCAPAAVATTSVCRDADADRASGAFGGALVLPAPVGGRAGQLGRDRRRPGPDRHRRRHRTLRGVRRPVQSPILGRLAHHLLLGEYGGPVGRFPFPGQALAAVPADHRHSRQVHRRQPVHPPQVRTGRGTHATHLSPAAHASTAVLVHHIRRGHAIELPQQTGRGQTVLPRSDPQTNRRRRWQRQCQHHHRRPSASAGRAAVLSGAAGEGIPAGGGGSARSHRRRVRPDHLLREPGRRNAESGGRVGATPHRR